VQEEKENGDTERNSHYVDLTKHDQNLY